MEKYNYLEAVINDVRTYVQDNNITVNSENYDEVYSSLYDDLFITDSVTGNASGSYTFNAWESEENLCHNLDLLKEALDEFGSDTCIMDNAEACDVTIRCYLLGEAVSTVLNEIMDDDDEDDDEDDDDEDEN